MERLGVVLFVVVTSSAAVGLMGSSWASAHDEAPGSAPARGAGGPVAVAGDPGLAPARRSVGPGPGGGDARSSRTTFAGAVGRDTVDVDGVARTWDYYVPSSARPRGGVVIALHGSGGSGARIRGFLAPTLERAADRHGFVVAYPDGLEGNWNDCRATAPFAANVRDVDDPGFVEAIVDRLEARHGIDRGQVGLMGFSNGGHMALRLVIERPRRFRRAVAFGASVPVPDEMDCRVADEPAAVMLVNGTADPVSPFGGGMVVVPPTGSELGRIRPARAAAAWLARRAGAGAPVDDTPVPADALGRSVDRTVWPFGSADVELWVVRGGGHTIPGHGPFPDWVGPVEDRLDAVDAGLGFLLRPSARTGEAGPGRTIRPAPVSAGSSVHDLRNSEGRELRWRRPPRATP